MPRPSIDTATEVTTAHKISVGLVVATASLVLVSAVVAAIYTLAKSGSGSASSVLFVPERPASTGSPDQVSPEDDRVLKTQP